MMSGESAGPGADVFSFGVVLWELCTLELPWSKTSPWQVGISNSGSDWGRIGARNYWIPVVLGVYAWF